MLRRALVEVVVRRQLLGLAVHGLARERADRASELLGAADAVALPERHRARGAGGGGDDHAVAGDLLDPPGGGAEQERLARPRLVDHLLVQLADAPAVGQVHAVQAAVGDRAGVGDRQLERALARPDRVLHAVPDDARPQLGELLGRVAAVEHVEHVVEQLARELGERVGAPHQLVQRRHAPARRRRRSSRRSAGRARRAGCAGPPSARSSPSRMRWATTAHSSRSARNLGKMRPFETSPTPCPARPIRCSPARDRLGRLHLDHEVHRAHVDAELERRGGHEAGQLARLQQVLHDQPLLARERAVVGASDAAARPILAASSFSRTPAARPRGGCSRR